jgi:TRAP-type C4-dicarboxylate transport system substrate-binding protein
MQHSMKGKMEHGAKGQRAGNRGAAYQLMTPEERTALQEKMRNATPEERQKIAEATRTQMQARAQEQGVTLPQHRGPRTGAASGPASAAQTPTTTAEHVH